MDFKKTHTIGIAVDSNIIVAYPPADSCALMPAANATTTQIAVHVREQTIVRF